MLCRRITGDHDHVKVAEELVKVFEDFDLLDMKKHTYSMSDGATNFGRAFDVYGQDSDEEEEPGDNTGILDLLGPPPVPQGPRLNLDETVSVNRGNIADRIDVLLAEDEIDANANPADIDAFVQAAEKKLNGDKGGAVDDDLADLNFEQVQAANRGVSAGAAAVPARPADAERRGGTRAGQQKGKTKKKPEKRQLFVPGSMDEVNTDLSDFPVWAVSNLSISRTSSLSQGAFF